jgi:Transglycosylase SLT domain
MKEGKLQPHILRFLAASGTSSSQHSTSSDLKLVLVVGGALILLGFIRSFVKKSKKLLPIVALLAVAAIVITHMSTVTSPFSGGGGTAATCPQPTDLPASPYVQVAENDARKHGIDPNCFVRQINQESSFDPNNKGPYVCNADGCGNAEGIGQYMSYRHDNFNHWDPIASLDHAAGDMASLYNHYHNYRKALAAYDWGEGNLASALSHGSSWEQYLPPETKNYIRIVMGS